jgi:hypothetical protein
MIHPVVGVFTTFTYYAAGYSLTNLIRSQIRQLTRGGYPPHLMVCDSFAEADQYFKEATIHKVIPVGQLDVPYKKPELVEKHKKLADNAERALLKMIDDHDLNLIFTHDIIFLNTHYPYAVAVERVSKKRPHVKWMHWIHSCPSGLNPIWQFKRYGPGHKIIFPNRTDALRVAEQFRTDIDDVWPIHHVKDIREFAEFSGPTNNFIDQYDLMNADIIQIYPASVDRLVAKGLDFLLKTFGAMRKTFKREVRLVICNQWCNVDKHRKTVEQYLEKGKKAGLRPDKDFIFSSRFEAPKWELGLPSKMVAELMMLGNLFMFPTHHESFGLVLPEASLMGGALVVANGSLDMMREITGNNALFWDYGSWHRDMQFQKPGEQPDRYWMGVARVIIGKMQNDMSIRARTHMRKSFNLDAIWNNELHPAMLALLNEAK